jgi:hypothetical protein
MAELPLAIAFVVAMTSYGLITRFCYRPIPKPYDDPHWATFREFIKTCPTKEELNWQYDNGFLGYNYREHKWLSYGDLAGWLNFPEHFDYYWNAAQQQRWRKK